MSLTLKFAGQMLPAWLVKGFVLAMSELEKLGWQQQWVALNAVVWSSDFLL